MKNMSVNELKYEGFIKMVQIAALADKGNYYICPYVDMGICCRTLPITILKISETDDEALFDAAIATMKYCRKATLEEEEECSRNGAYDEISDHYGFKKTTGLGISSFDRKGIPNVTLSITKDNQFEFWYMCNATRQSGFIYCSIDSPKEEKSKILREALNRSITFK